MAYAGVHHTRLRAATELAGIINNDAAAPVRNIADNIDYNEQLADNIDYNEQLIDAAAVHNIGNQAINNDPHYVVVEESNNAAAPVGNIADSIDNNEQLIDAALNIDCYDVADGQLIDAVVGNDNNETHYAAVHNIKNTLMAPTIRYLNDELELRDGRMCDLEAIIVNLESKMTALSDTVGWPSNNWSRCTLPNSSYKSVFSLDDVLKFGGQGEGEGGEDIGDNEEEKSGNGDQKQKAYKRRRAPKTNDVNGRRMKITKQTADNTTRCAQSTDAISYYRKFPNSRRSNIRATQANAGLINADIICYSNAIFQCIASY